MSSYRQANIIETKLFMKPRKAVQMYAGLRATLAHTSPPSASHNNRLRETIRQPTSGVWIVIFCRPARSKPPSNMTAPTRVRRTKCFSTPISKARRIIIIPAPAPQISLATSSCRTSAATRTRPSTPPTPPQALIFTSLRVIQSSRSRIRSRQLGIWRK